MSTSPMSHASASDLAAQIDRYLPREIQEGIEERYYALINAQAMLDHFAQDPAFLQDPGRHPALYTDHGVLHVRDVARQVLYVLDTANGLLVPQRNTGRLEFMRGYGVMLAYIHDIGMADSTPFGLEMHAEFATQDVFDERFDDWIDAIWKDNCGNVAWRLINLYVQEALEQDPKIVLREMLAMANAHSKTKIPLPILNDPHALRYAMQLALGMDLHALRLLQQVERVTRKTIPPAGSEAKAMEGPADPLRTVKAPLPDGTPSPNLSNNPNPAAHAFYDNYARDAFAWLVSEHEATRALVSDVIDTLRALRCADALHPKGTVLKTSGGYQILLDRLTANAVYVFSRGTGETFLVEADNLVSGKANLESCELTREGDLRLSFVRGSFPDRQITRRAAHNAALVIHDIQADAVESFVRRSEGPTASEEAEKPAQKMRILLEGVADNLQFVEIVREELEQIDPAAARRIGMVASLHSVSDRERAHYLKADPIAWNLTARKEFMKRLAERGHRTEHIDPEKAFAEVRLARLPAGEVLIEAGSPSGFLYVPMGEGLVGTSPEGYLSFPVEAWAPLGAAGIIRGAVRNATVVSNAEVSVLIIPRETYLAHWYRTYNLQQFTDRLSPR